jgi:Spy/CpxP family protein refolding chaperone
MSKKIPLMTAIAVSCFAWFAASSAGEPTATPTDQQVFDRFRSDLQATSADLMAKGLTLTADQAAKFWPLYQQFQKEQDAIVEGQLRATQRYASVYQNVSDSDAVGYINALLERDQKVHDLRVKWLAKFQSVVPTKIAARAIQLERRLGNITQIKMSSEIPLIQ